jgi:hypothetical protein
LAVAVSMKVILGVMCLVIVSQKYYAEMPPLY